MIEDNVFDVLKKKSKRKKAQLPNIVHKLQHNFNFSVDQLKHYFILPHRVVHKSYVKAFQYKELTSILYTNTKLHKSVLHQTICALSARLSQKLIKPLFYHCSHFRQFWTNFESYW